jgi:hypothetical protein
MEHFSHYYEFIINEHYYKFKSYFVLALFPSVFICYLEYPWVKELGLLFFKHNFAKEETFVLAIRLSQLTTCGIKKRSLKCLKLIMQCDSWIYSSKTDSVVFILLQLITSLFVFNITQVLIFTIIIFNIRSLLLLRYHYRRRQYFCDNEHEYNIYHYAPFNDSMIIMLYKYSLTHDICQDILQNCKPKDSKQSTPLILETITMKYNLLTKILPKELCNLIMTFYNLDNFTIKLN